MKKTPYEVLGVDKAADTETIKKAYRKRSKETHPDKGGKPEDFHQASRAFALLMDAERRADFDATGNTEEKKAPNWLEPLMDAFKSALQEYIVKGEPIGRKVQNRLKARHDALYRDEEAMGEAIARAEMLLKKIKFKGKGENFLARETEAAIEGISRQRKSASDERSVIKLAMDMAAEYEITEDFNPNDLTTAMFDDLLRQAGLSKNYQYEP